MCNCIEETNKSLADLNRNTKLDIPIMFNRTTGLVNANRVKIATCKLDDRNKQKPIVLIPSYCPFCGKRYEEKRDEQG